MLIELVRRDDTNCGRVWPWSKKRFLWQLRVDGELVAVEVQCSWRSEKCRVAVNGEVVHFGSLVDYEFFHRQIPLVVKLAGHSADLLVDGVPADYFSQTMRTQQESLMHSIQTTGSNSIQPGGGGDPSAYAVFVDGAESVNKPLLY